MIFSLPFLAVAAVVSPQIAESSAFVMTIDSEGRAVCASATPDEWDMIRDHSEVHLREIETDTEIDYLVDSSGVVTLKFGRGVPRSVRNAAWHAMDIWFDKLEITIPFTLTVYWEELEEGINGEAPLGFVLQVWDDEEKEGSWSCWSRIDWGCQPMPLANQIAGRRIIGRNDPDPEFEIHINKDSPWYTGIDGRPGSHQFDLLSTILHEIGHAVGISSGFRPDHDERTGRALWDDSKYSVYYDQFVWSRDEGDLLDLNSPSDEIYDAMTGNRLFWGRRGQENWYEEPLLSVERNGGPILLWASPDATTRGGTLVSHLDADAYPRYHRDHLMGPFGYPGTATHQVGPVTLGMLYDLGWKLKGFERDLSGDDPVSTNPDAHEWKLITRMIGSEESGRSVDYLGVLIHIKGEFYGLMGLTGKAPAPEFTLLHAEPIDSRSATVHMKTDSEWVPHLALSAKNQDAPSDEFGLEYSSTVELSGSDLQSFLRSRKMISLHVHFQGDSRRTILTFPLREPIN